MKKLFSIIAFAFMICLVGTSCIKQNEPLLGSESVVEFDATVLNTPLTGQTYPVLSRVPAYGAAVSNARPAITRTSGEIKFRVNLVGAQSSTDRSIGINVVANPVLPVNSLGESMPAAQEGVHFTVPDQVVIPANSSFGEVTVTILDPGASTGSRGLVLELTPATSLTPSNNYKYLGISISQN